MDIKSTLHFSPVPVCSIKETEMQIIGMHANYIYPSQIMLAPSKNNFS